jgi:hypothetical protein
MKDDQPAFPVAETTRSHPYKGMSLRDYFAAKAMQSFIHFASPSDTDFDYEAKAAYKVADAMMEARK